MKPSATQIFRSASPPTCFPLLGSCLFIGFLSWALIPMHSIVDFQVEWPKLLFKSRPQIPCRDINLSLCSFEMVVHDVATSISCRDINLLSRHQSLVATSAQVFCRLQMVAPDVATSISCRDINLMNCNFQLMSSVVTTSILCRDLTLCLCRFH